ncbi:MAG: hypothetical protein H6739_39725 [Alphaproteobacteria bacterium]|nr:hypothetical protein [Alphaproteobacteria bacterium]
MRSLTLVLLGVAAADVIPLEPARPDADDVAARMAEACGPVYAQQEIAFTFVVEKDGEEKARRRHVWSPQGGTVTSSWEGFETTLVKLDPPTGAEGAAPEDVEQAHGAFINDSYWLLAPCKVLDPGVRRSLDTEGRLVLSFEGVGLTPGDTYTFTIGPDGLPTQWAFTLQSGRQGAFTWAGHQRFGALNLSTRHVAIGDGGVVIRFEEISVR